MFRGKVAFFNIILGSIVLDVPWTRERLQDGTRDAYMIANDDDQTRNGGALVPTSQISIVKEWAGHSAHCSHKKRN